MPKTAKLLLSSLALSALLLGLVTLPSSLVCLFMEFHKSQSSKGFSSIFIRESGGLRGESTMRLCVQEKDGWLFIGEVEDSDFGKRYPGAFWSRDNTVIVGQEDSENLFGYDFVAKKPLRSEAEVAAILKQRGGKGSQIFEIVSEFSQVARHPWWWELSWLQNMPIYPKP